MEVKLKNISEDMLASGGYNVALYCHYIIVNSLTCPCHRQDNQLGETESSDTIIMGGVRLGRNRLASEVSISRLCTSLNMREHSE